MPAANCHRIVIACHAWSDDLVGGSFKVATDWARYLAQRGHEVHYVCGGNPSIPSQREIDGVRVWCYGYPAKSGIAALRTHLRESRESVRRLNAEFPIDALVGHTPLQYLGALQGDARKRIPTRMYCVHSPFMDEVAGGGISWRNWPQRQLARNIDLRCVEQSTVVTTDSKFTLERFIQLYGRDQLRHGCVRSAWVDTDRFQPIADPRRARKELGGPWDTDLPILLTLRRLEPRMGLDRLVEAARIVRDAGHPFRLFIAGGGSMYEPLQQQIMRLDLSETVTLLGRVPDDDLATIYAASDCFVLPTAALECFGLIILESYACGVPVIATPVGAIPEIVSQASSDWLTDDTSAASIARRIEMFLDGQLRADPNQLRRISLDYHLDRRAAELESLMLSNMVGGIAVDAVAEKREATSGVRFPEQVIQL